MIYRLVVSIVLYRNDPAELRQVLDSVLNDPCVDLLCLVDNSPDRTLEAVAHRPKVNYHHMGKNVGFGAAHNSALCQYLPQSEYFLVLNPDVSFDKGVLEQCLRFLDQNPGVGLMMPKVLYPDGELQQLCKLLPSPLHLFVRRFIPIRAIQDCINRGYVLPAEKFTEPTRIPSLSGCFMLFRSRALLDVGLFDERYFMYMEDVDLSRRVGVRWDTVYFPAVNIVHEHAKGSYKNPKLLRYHLESAFRYFQKWGWFLDRERAAVNRSTRKAVLG